MLEYALNAVPKEEDMIQFGDGKYCNVFESDQFSCGMLVVPPGLTAGYDAGHRDADEVFFIAQGSAMIDFPSLNKKTPVRQGEFIMMPRNEPHVVSNTSGEALKLVFVCSVSPDAKR